MTVRRTPLWPLVLVATQLLVGAAVVGAPKVTLVICLGVLVAVTAAYRAPFALGAVLVLFPILPSGLSAALGTNALNPQRLLVGLLLGILVVSPQTWAGNAWRLRVLARPMRYMAAFLAIGLLSATLSPLPRSALAGVGFYGLQLCGVMIAGCLLASRARLDSYLIAVSVASIVVAGLAAFEYVAPHGSIIHLLGPVFDSGQDSNSVRALPRRVSGPLAHPVSLGDFSVLTLPFALRAAVSDVPRCARLGTAAVLSLLVAVMLSQTRMALLAVPVAFGVWLIASDRRRRGAGIAIAASVVLIGVFGGTALTTEGNVLNAVLSYRGQTSSTNPGTENVDARRSIYTTAWRAFDARPVLGYGFRVPTEHAQASFFLRFGQPYAFESYLVVVPLEGGVLGVIAFAGFFGSLLMVVRRHMPAATDRAVIYASLAVALVLALASNPFDDEVTYLWLLMGVMLGVGLRRPEAPRRC